MYDDYLLLKISVERDSAEEVETALLKIGALSCTLQDATDTPIHEPAPGQVPLWGEVEVTGMFSNSADRDLLLHLLEAEIGTVRRQGVSVKTLQGREWERAWMDDFAPRQICDSLWVVPSFCEVPDKSAINLMIDPGLAFGSGTHATTTLCLQWLAKLNLANKTVIDYGCGSGILAIAAARLGARRVYAFDIDPQALTATRENAERNDTVKQIQICHTDRDLGGQEESGSVDVLVANILLRPLLDLHNRFFDLLDDDGRLGLSGILADQAPMLAGAYARQFQHRETEMLDEWALHSAVKQNLYL